MDVLGWTPAGSTPPPQVDDYANSLADGTHPIGTVAVNGSSTGTLEVNGDRDWFAIQLAAGVNYTIDLQGQSSGAGTLVDPYLRLHDSSGALLLQNDDITTGTNRDSRISFTATSAGTYYIEAGGFSDSYAGTYRVGLTAASTPTDDFANTLSDRSHPFGAVVANGTATGALELTGDRDWFLVQLTASVTYTINLQGQASGAGTLEDPYLRLHDSSGALLAQNDDITLGTNRDSQLTFTATASGGYYIEAGAYNDAFTGSYRVGVVGTAPPPDDFANSRTDTSHPFGAATVGGSATGVLEVVGDRDWFSIQLSAGSTYTIDLRGQQGGGGTLSDPYLRIHDSSGALLASNDDIASGGSLNSEVTFQATASGVYYIEAGAYADNLTGSYTVSVADSTVHNPNLVASNLAFDGSIVSWLVGNIGSSGAAASTAGIYLSTDTAITASDQLLSTYTTPTEIVGAFDSESLAPALPGNATPGTYYLGALADSGGVVTESNEADNASNVIAVILDNGGDDTVKGGPGDDFAFGMGGSDTIDGGPGNDLLDGGAGSDTASYGSALAAVRVNLGTTGFQDTGGAGFDSLVRIESLSGSAFGDDLTGDSGNNTLIGGGGDDSLTGAAGDDSLDGGAGLDTASYAGAGGAVTVDLSVLTAQSTSSAGADTLTGIENLTGSGFDDTLSGDTGSNTLGGGGGNDTLDGGGGADTLDGSAGLDTASYGSATSSVRVNIAVAGGQDTGGAGVDTLIRIENLTGSAFADDLSGDTGNNTLIGGGGDDTLDGGSGADLLDGSAGVDTASYASAASSVAVDLSNVSAQDTGGGGVDTLTGIENLTGSAFADILTGDGGDNLLTGGGGADTLDGAGGADVLDGSAGVDTASYASAGSAVTVSLGASGAQATGGAGSDTLVRIENLTGSGFDDTLSGDGGANIVSGGGGNDTLDGGGGADILDGSAGVDTASYVSAGASVVVSLAVTGGQDTFGAGVDTLIRIENLNGSGFSDSLTGDSGNNALIGGGGSDTLDGSAGTDAASYASAASSVRVDLSNTSGQDTGAAGVDTLVRVEDLIGSAFADDLSGDGGNNTLTGGGGNDTLDGGGGNDILDGSAGVDTASYASALAAVAVSLGASGAQGTGGAGIDILVRIENLTGSGFDDTLVGDAGDNLITGGAGADTLDGGGGNDILDGSAGSDTASYASAGSAVAVSLGASGAQATGGAGSDILVRIENLTGSGFDDSLTGDGGSNIIVGGAGADTINGGGGDDILDGSAGSDTASYASAGSSVRVSLAAAGGQDTLGAGIDTLIRFENITGSAFSDDLAGDSGANTLTGGGGSDTLDGGGGNDILDGSAGVDTASYVSAGSAVAVSLGASGAQATGGAGSDILVRIENLVGSGFDDALTGDGGDNLITGGAGADTLEGGGGNDTLDGSAGSDTASYASAASAVAVSLGASGAQATGGAGSDILVRMENLTGSSFGDALTGDSGSNIIVGGAGDDTIDGGAGADILDGSTGSDTASYASAGAGVAVNLAAAGGQDTAGAGVDTLIRFENLIGSGFNDALTGDGGSNILTGGAGDDTLDGGAGNDILDGSAGSDMASYASAASAVVVSLSAAGGQDTGGSGIDTLIRLENLTGSNFDDILTGDGGANLITGGAGADTLDGGAGADILDGSAGSDTASYASAGSAVAVSLAAAGGQNTGGAGNDTLIRIENLTGSGFDDTLTGDGGTNVIIGGGGADTLDGGAGDDILDGSAGSDTASYASAGAAVQVGLALTGGQNTGGAGTDTLIRLENLAGSGFDDTLAGDGAANVIVGGAGADTLDGGAGADTLDGAAGIDTASYSSAASAVAVSLSNAGPQNTGGAGVDTLVRIENLTGSGFDDVLAGDGGDNLLIGGGGSDTLDGAGGNDTLDGSAGSDTASYASAGGAVTLSLGASGAQATGGAGSDTLVRIENLTGSGFADVLSGDGGANVIVAGGGDDTVDGGDGDDILDGSAGVDTVSYASAGAGVAVSLAAAGGQDTTGAGVDTLIRFENLTGSGFNDSLSGDGGANILIGAAGSDTIIGGDGDDVVLGGAGADILDGSAGVDTASYAAATSAVTVNLALAGGQDTQGDGNDTLIRMENLTGSGFADTLTGDGGVNVLTGGGGNDTLDGGAGDDTLDGSAGVDMASYASAGSSVSVSLAVQGAQDTLGAGHDTLIGVEWLTGSGFNDSLGGDGGDNLLSAGGGDDTVIGGGGNDTLDGGAGADILDGSGGADTASYASALAGVQVSLAVQGGQDTLGDGNDTLIRMENLTGSAFGDTLTGDSSANVLTGGGGSDVITGGGGADTFAFTDLADSSAGGPDMITDFATGSLIDLSAIDADTTAGGDQAFHIGGGGGHAGDIVVSYNSGTNRTTLDLYVDNDGAVDARILLVGDHSGLTAGDFIL